MAQEYTNLCRAMARVAASASGAGVQPTYTWSAGFNVASASNTHTATGVYALVLDNAAASTDCAIFVSPLEATADCSFKVVQTSDTVITVTTYAAGAASDAVGFNVSVYGKPNT